jgi:hypothetical protein
MYSLLLLEAEHEITRGDLWLAILSGAFLLFSSILAVQWTFHKQNREDQRKQREIEEQTGRDVATGLREHPLHSHIERDGEVLTESGIFPPQQARRRP